MADVTTIKRGLIRLSTTTFAEVPVARWRSGISLLLALKNKIITATLWRFQALLQRGSLGPAQHAKRQHLLFNLPGI